MEMVLTDSLERELEQRYLEGRFPDGVRLHVPVSRWLRHAAATITTTRMRHRTA